ncbi:NAD(P)H-binding protein [Kribbella solani]|uniref:NAD(P)-dependent oxidoreductase n=1 Tax=Kribbella solani TaxID=236067 RepID=UPI0029A177DB|nr:NAD(P)H-binding protein [Kribbella solani]MDX3005709.1 NAD(P)H-binding protein [Kribbella solani]
MSKILVIGARGRAARAAITEATERGHDVLGVARTPDTPAAGAASGAGVGDPDVGGAGVGAAGAAGVGGGGVVVGDVTDAARIAELARGRDAVVAAVYDGGSDPSAFFPAAARALVDGLTKAGVNRLVWVGLASILPTADGTLLMDTDGYPREYRSFFLAHQAALDVFAASTLDWVSIAPTGDFDHADPARRGGYRVAPGNAEDLISYADLAVALIDEVDHPAHHRTAIGVVV